MKCSGCGERFEIREVMFKRAGSVKGTGYRGWRPARHGEVSGETEPGWVFIQSWDAFCDECIKEQK